MSSNHRTQLVSVLKSICKETGIHINSEAASSILNILANETVPKEHHQYPYINVPEYISYLIDEGIEVTIKKDSDDQRVLDLNVRAKSHLHLAEDPDSMSGWKAKMRYNEEEEIFDFDHLLIIAKSCMLGRGGIAKEWADLLIKHGFLEVVTETKTYYR